jgi:uncharacterized membrane protein YdjX (TVP38/TMEM64 family)
VDAHGAAAPFVYMAAFVGAVLLHLPGMPLVAIGALLFEPAEAFLYGWIAILVGTTLTFLLVRWFFRQAFQGALQARFPWLRRLDDRLVSNGFATVLVLRLLLCMAPPLNFALGATRVRFVDYLAGTAVGVLPGMGLAIAFADTIAHSHAASTHLTAAHAGGIVLLVVTLAIGVRLARRYLGAGPTDLRPGAEP